MSIRRPTRPPDAQGQGENGNYGSDGIYGHGDYEGVVSLTEALLSFTDTVALDQWPAMDVIQHEMNEVLGISGYGSFAAIYPNSDPVYAHLVGLIGDLMTNRIVGRCAASQIASASATSFFCRFTNGFT